MKKLILTVVAAAMLALPAAQAQKINKDATLAKLAKSDADIADAKKGVKAATWMNRGKVYFEALAEPTKNLFAPMEAAMLKLTCGEPTSSDKENINGVEYTALVYPYFVAYEKDGKVVAWKQTQEVKEGALQTAIDAYKKANELDPKVADKAKEGLVAISNFCSQLGNVSIDAAQYKTGADAFKNAYDASMVIPVEKPNTALLYYAGYMYAVDGANDVESFAKGAECLNDALNAGYSDESGDVYYYLFHCYYGQKAKDAAFVMKAKDALVKGIEGYPKNQKILDGLMNLYTAEEGIGNPADLVSRIDAAIEADPKNVDLWYGRGRVFFALKNYDECISSFSKVVELTPDSFEGNYYLGYFYIVKGDAANDELSKRPYTGAADYENGLKAVNAIYAQAIPCLEKAHELQPKDYATVEYLRSLCFRLRDEPGVMDKFNKYKELSAQLKPAE